MKSISRVVLENFQKHSYKVVDFSDYSVITGPSDRGKTAIFRAIKWCLYNSPSGASFIKQGTTKCKVTVIFNDGTQIIREKGSGVNSYDIILPSGENIHLEHFGTGAVEEVLKAHGMIEIDFCGSKQVLNMCEQLSQPFFVGESPTNKALMIGKLANTDVIDLSIKNTASDLRQSKARVKEYKAELKEVKSELSELKNLSSMDKAIEYSEKRLEQIKYLELKINNIQSLLSDLGEFENRRVMLEKRLEAEGCYDGVDDNIGQALDILDKISKISKISSNLNKQEQKLRLLKDIASIASVNDIDEVISMIDEVAELSANIVSIEAKARRIRSLSKQKKELEKLPNESDIDDILKDISEAMDIVQDIAKIRPVNSKFKDSIHRKSRGGLVIDGLEVEHREAIKRYKDGLIESKSCPVCMADMTEDKLHKIDECL